MFKRKSLYYFCEETLTYKKKKGIQFNSIVKTSIFVIVFIVAINLVSGNLLGDFFYNVIQFEKRNILISKHVSFLKTRIDSLQVRINKLLTTDKNLRLMVNLPLIESEIKEVGVGGRSLDPSEESYRELDFSDAEVLENAINKISRQVHLQQNSYSEILSKYSSDQKLFECIPAIKPMLGTYDKHSFGMRRHPILGYIKMHEGVDIIAPDGTEIFASGKGRVEKIGYDRGYGLILELDHGYGYKSMYAHLSSVRVTVGQEIKRGQIIANCGHSGFTTGPHLHYEISLYGKKLNPVTFFIDDVEGTSYTMDMNSTL